MTGWFTEDFTWDELSDPRMPRTAAAAAARSSATFDGAAARAAAARRPRPRARGHRSRRGREIGVVLEIKHATYFAVPRVGSSPNSSTTELARGRMGRTARCLSRSSRSSPPCCSGCRNAASGRPTSTCSRPPAGRSTFVSQQGKAAPTYRQTAAPEGAGPDSSGRVDGISVDKRMILAPDKLGRLGSIDGRSPTRTSAACGCSPGRAGPRTAFLIGRVPRAGRTRRQFGDWEAEWAVIRDAGVDGVFVDHPDLGVAFFGSRRTARGRI